MRWLSLMFVSLLLSGGFVGDASGHVLPRSKAKRIAARAVDDLAYEVANGRDAHTDPFNDVESAEGHLNGQCARWSPHLFKCSVYVDLTYNCIGVDLYCPDPETCFSGVNVRYRDASSRLTRWRFAGDVDCS